MNLGVPWHISAVLGTAQLLGTLEHVSSWVEYTKDPTSSKGMLLFEHYELTMNIS